MIISILKQGIPFAIGLALLNIIMDYSDGTLANENFLNEYVIKSLIVGLIFGTLITFYKRFKEKKHTQQ